jgi:hypothetical protein
MSAAQPAADASPDKREPVLDTVERVSEMCFGLFMALTFVGAVSVATAGQEDPARTMLVTALGCNLAWGLVDAVMYLVRTITTRGRKITTVLAVRAAPDAASGVKVLRDALPPLARVLLADAELETARARLVARTDLPDRPRLYAADWVGAVGIFLIVVATTFPVALPFVIIKDLPTAMLVSRCLTIAMLFGGGFALGRFAGYSGWKEGLSMTALGLVLTVAIIALGG